MNNQEKFQQLLRVLFQFDCSDLDFGIYRIMNHKRDVIEKFITQDLPGIITAELSRGALAAQSQLVQQLDELATQIKQAFSQDAIDPSGNLVDAYRNTNLGQEYLSLQSQSLGARSSQVLESVIYNQLYAFFSRYYQDGDFISKRRYSKHERYAIPYNGEEVYLYWANHDQYYIKTAEFFTDYTFVSSGVTVHFKLNAADVEQDNIKGDKRFFLPRPAEISWDESARQLVIPFEYRPLTEQENITYGKKNQQETIISRSITDIPKRLSPKTASTALAALAVERRRTSDGEPVTALEHHLRQYTRRNTSDFFIHKDLLGFLSQELDFYLKNEVLNLDEMDAAGEERAESWFQIMRLIKAVGARIIEFLAQIENFQKMLWEKRKFITQTWYCITLNQVSSDFYPEIASCQAQWDEWQALFHIDQEHPDLFIEDTGLSERRMSFLSTHPTLVIDTRYFSPSFVDRLLASFDDLDEITDGLLVHSENWQALNFLSELYREQINCFYIDPPYNAASSEIIYKNSYKNSSWISLLENRIRRSLPLLNIGDCYAIAIDDYEMAHLCELVDSMFGDYDRRMVVVNHHPQGGMSGNISRTHEYMIMMTPKSVDILSGKQKSEGYEYRSFMLSGPGKNKSRMGRWRSFYAILIDEVNNRIIGLEPPPLLGQEYPTTKTDQGFIRRYPISPNGEEKVWCRSYDSAVEGLEEGGIVISNTGAIKLAVNTKGKRFNLMSNWTDSKYNAGPHGTALLADILGSRELFSYPKSIYTVIDGIEAMTWHQNEPNILDFFAGSGTTGHAVISLNRDDGDRRKFILVEMADYFNTVLLPRIKKVTFTPEWKDGQPKRQPTPEEAERSPRLVKVIRLESYEDTLNNIAFDDEAGQQTMQFDDYLLQYMLRWETRASDTFLNVQNLSNPFNYQLQLYSDGQTRTRSVDITETFNYLLGLHIQSRRIYDNNGRRYLVYRGQIDHRRIVVIWRDTQGWQPSDYEHDQQFVAGLNLTANADEIFVNGDSYIPGARALEPVFKARMFASVEQ